MLSFVRICDGHHPEFPVSSIKAKKTEGKKGPRVPRYHLCLASSAAAPSHCCRLMAVPRFHPGGM